MTVKDRRREVRISTEDDDLLTEAAGLTGVSVTEFLLDRAVSDATDVVATHRTIALGDADYKRFLAALDSPVQTVKELHAQVRKARRLNLDPPCERVLIG
jgi:uncharacterized protein (DUF1778 family)